MGLESLEIEPDPVSLPPRLKQLTEQVWEEIQTFLIRKRNEPVKGFQPSDFEEAYRCLAHVKSMSSGPSSSPALCEWGSGFPVVSFLAEQLGFKATAIESDRDLFMAGQKWLESVGSEVRTLHGSFIPADIGLQLEDELRKGILRPGKQDSLWLDLQAQPVYRENVPAVKSITPNAFQVIYAYPWPGEELFIFRLFELVASPGSLLLSFHGAADFRLHRKA